MGIQKPQGFTRHSTLLWEGSGANKRVQNSQRGVEAFEDVVQRRRLRPLRFKAITLF